MSEPRIEISGLTPRVARRMADVADALVLGGVPVVALRDARLYDLDPPRCPECDRRLEGGHCYHCDPVWGYAGPAEEATQ